MTATSERRRRASRKNGKKGGRPHVSHVADYAACGDPPADPLEAVAVWVVSLLNVSAQKIWGEGDMGREARSELRTTARVLAKLRPLVQLYAAEQMVLRRARERKN